jgi:hypothetical protein
VVRGYQVNEINARDNEVLTRVSALSKNNECKLLTRCHLHNAQIFRPDEIYL